MELIERLKTIEEQYEELNRRLSDQKVLADQAEYTRLARSHAELSELAEKIKEYRATLDAVREAQEMLSEDHDEEMDRYLKSELHEQAEKRDGLEAALREMLVTKDPNDAKDVIMEIRAGAGGDEASLFAADLYRMYTRYAEAHGWKPEVLSSSPSDLGGFKEIIFEIKGRGAYSRLKYESGVHRVQRIPVTESGGRIHTSTATVAVLPEVEDVEVEVNPQDVRVDIFRSSGPGGQSVNTTDSAVRVTHVPTGIVVSCQEERSQLQNRDRAMRILRARIYEKAREEQAASVAEARRSQVGTGDRSERIRTYNFPQNRVTDHRIGVTIHDLESVLQGNLEKLIESLAAADRAEAMKQVV